MQVMGSLTVLCGVDEAGRGPWAGPVCAGAVVLSARRPVEGLADSKTLTADRRAALALEIRARAEAFGLGWASHQEIDQFNIRQATHLAMRRAVSALGLTPCEALIDGNDVPGELPCPARAIIRGDASEPAISAAGILAKVARDALMAQLDAAHPGYGFASHKGYGTRAHSDALARLGPSAVHRMSFAPVRKAAARIA